MEAGLRRIPGEVCREGAAPGRYPPLCRGSCVNRLPENLPQKPAATALLLLVTLPFVVLLALTGCGSSSHAGNAMSDYTLSATPASVSLAPGGSATMSVLATATGSFTSTVGVALSGLPTGVTSSPSTLTLTPGAAQTLTLKAAANAGPGSATITLTGTAGTLVHTVATPLTLTAPAPAPDFSMTVTPTHVNITAGFIAEPVVVSATALNGFTGKVSVALTGLPAGLSASPATLTLTPGTPQTVNLVAASTATASSSTVTFTGTSGTSVHTASLALTVAAAPVPDVTTYHYDSTRQGQNTQETILNPANVNATTFGKTGFYTTDGAVDAQPLFAANVPVNAGTTKNLVYVATEHDTVYAFSPAIGQPAWSTSILGAGESPSDNGCYQISPEVGITATPVIDRKQGPHGAIFVVGMSVDGSGVYHQRLHALDLGTGAELAGSPTEIGGSYPGTGESAVNGLVSFTPSQYAERAGLLLLNGTIYMSWTSHCDQQPYQGWVMGYSESSLQQTSVINLTPNGGQGSIWMSGYGLAADTTGNIYFLDANGSFSGSVTSTGFPLDLDYGNAILKLSTTGGTLAVADFFQPYNTIDESNQDIDLGSGGGMLLPDLTDSAGNVHHLLVGAGKDSNIYVANRDNLGRYNSTNNASLYQELPGALPSGAWSGPAYFNNTVYYAGVNDILRAFPINNAMLATSPSSVSPTAFSYPGTTPTISANGTTNGIVWAVDANQGILHAYDATNLSNELYNTSQAANSRDSFGTGSKFITPMEVNGSVYIGTPTGVAVFGLLPASN